VVPGADLEARLEQEEKNLPEAIVRRRREQAEARERARWRAAQRQKAAVEAAERAKMRFPLAQNLDRMGKTSAALDYYSEIARDAPDTEEGRRSAQRIATLAPAAQSP
jgi:hypothetical protein